MNYNIHKLINNNNWVKIYQLMINNKIDINMKFVNGNTLAHLGFINNNVDIINFFLKADKIYLLKISNDDGNTPIHLLALYGYTNQLKKCLSVDITLANLINNNNDNVANLLYNDIDLISFIIRESKSLDHINKNVIIKNIEESQKCDDNNYNIIKLLLDYDFNYINNFESLLTYSAQNNKNHICELLIKYGYDVNKKDELYLTPFIYAVIEENCDLMKILINNGANINYNGPNNDNNVLIYSINNNNNEQIDILLDNGYDMDKYDKLLNTPLHYAIYNIDTIFPTILAKLIYHGNLNIKNLNQETALHLLCRTNKWRMYDNIIINKELDIFINDKFGKKPIDYLINNSDVYDFMDIIINSYRKLLKNVELDKLYQQTDISNMVCRQNSIKCLDQLKKYMIINKRSIPSIMDKQILSKKINMIIGQNRIIGIFNADSLHNIIYTFLILSRYKNVSIPFQYYLKDKFMNDIMLLQTQNLYKSEEEQGIINLLNMYTNYFYEFLPYLIIWKSNTENYYHKDLNFLIRKSLNNKSVRFVFLKLSILVDRMGHANILVYDKKLNILERFEPYGITGYVDNNDLDDFIERICRENINKNLTYLKPSDIFDGIGFQVISNDNEPENKILGDPNGYCLAWVFWYLEMRLSNPDVSSKDIIKLSLDNITKLNENVTTDKKFISFIRNYATKLDNEKNNFLISIGIKPENIYNIVPTVDDLKKILSNILITFYKIMDKN